MKIKAIYEEDGVIIMELVDHPTKIILENHVDNRMLMRKFNNKSSSMKEQIKLSNILIDYKLDNITLEKAENEILLLSAWRSEPCGLLHSTDWNGKCFKCGEQVFVREHK